MPYIYEYERPSVTTDVVVIAFSMEGAWLLLIERARDPFAGHWALPGGFLDPYESLEAGTIRELAEETRLRPGSKLLRGVRLHPAGVHGERGRDPRGWIVTVAHAVLVDPAVMPQAVAGDDARRVEWLPLVEVSRIPLAFDHNRIVGAAMRGLAAGLAVSDDILRFLPEPFVPGDFVRLMAPFECLMPGEWAHIVPSLIARNLIGRSLIGPGGGKHLVYKRTSAGA